MASISDKITDTRNSARPNSAKVTASRSAGVTTLACDNLAGWPTASAVHFATYQIDTNNDPVAGTQVDWKGLVSGNNIGTLTVADGTDAGNSVGDIVEMLPTAKWGQDLADALTVGHTRAGVHSASLPLTSPVLTTPVIADFTSATHTHATTAQGGQLTASALGTDSSWAWQSWVPTWTNLTVSGSTVTAKYTQVGKTVRMRIAVVLAGGNAPSGDVAFSLPVTSVTYAGTATAQPIGQAKLVDTGTRSFNGTVVWASTTTAKIFAIAADLTVLYTAALSSTVPHTWANTDEILIEAIYEAA